MKYYFWHDWVYRSTDGSSHAHSAAIWREGYASARWERWPGSTFEIPRIDESRRVCSLEVTLIRPEVDV